MSRNLIPGTSFLSPLSVEPKELGAGDKMCFVVKVMITERGYRLYRCNWTPGEINPQGHHVSADLEQTVAEELFPVLGWAQLEPAP